MPLVVYVLGLGIFSMTTSEFMVAGVMPLLAQEFGASIADIGYLISAYAVAMVVGGPVLTFALLRMPRRTTLLALVLVFLAGQVVGALAPTYGVMMVGRVITGVAASAFFGVALTVAADLVGPQLRGRASSIVLGGLMVGTVVGLPAATLIAQHAGWRASFWAVAGLTLLVGLVMATTIPSSGSPDPVDLRAELTAFRNRDLWAAYATSALLIGAVFAVFSYFSPLFTEVSGFSPSTVPVLLVLYGAATIVGNVIVGRLADRYTLPTLAVGLLSLMLLTAALGLFADRHAVTVVTVVLIGLVGVPMNPAMATRVMRIAGARPLVNTVHTAVINIGIAIGPWIGGLAISAGAGLRAPAWVGAALAAAGLLTLLPHLHRRSTAPTAVSGAPADTRRQSPSPAVLSEGTSG